MSITTQQIFSTWLGFIDYLTAGFGALDKKGDVVRSLKGLKQKKSIVAYTREFEKHFQITE